MSPTARNHNCGELQGGVFPIMRTQKLEASELQALYGEDEDCGDDGGRQGEEDQLPAEHVPGESVDEFTFLADRAAGTPPCSRRHSYVHSAHTHLHREVFFSNRAYYCKLEELKKTHLKNIADLQRLYLSQLASAQRDRRRPDGQSKQVAPRPQPNADPQQKLMGSDRSEASWDEQASEPEDEPEWENTRRESHAKQAHLTPPPSPPPLRNWCPFPKISSSPSPANQQSCRVEKADTRRRGSKVTVPQPFQMTLREEERKLRRVKTRSEVELENERLRKELDELKECGRKFRATPAPASTHLPPYQPAKEHVEPQGHHGNGRLQKKPSPGRRVQDKPSPGRRVQDKPSPGRRVQDKPSPGCRVQDKPSPGRRVQDKPSPGRRLQGNRHSAPPLPQQPFSFIERERKKKEMKLLAELNSLTPREERRAFKARPVPRSLYRCNWQDFQLYGAISLHRPNSAAPPGCLEESQHDEEANEDVENDEDEVFLPHRGWGEKRRSTERVKKEQKGERERDWSYIHPLRRASVSRSHEVLPACKSDYISV